MKVLIFGATGMVGQGVLRECLRASDVDLVVTIGRTATGQQNPKLREIVQPELVDYSPIEHQLSDIDACFFCLGITSFRMKEADYTRITYTSTMVAAETLSRLNPKMTFIYISGVGTDSSEHGRSMWARVKGRTENSLLRLFKGAYMFRPGLIVAVHGARPCCIGVANCLATGQAAPKIKPVSRSEPRPTGTIKLGSSSSNCGPSTVDLLRITGSRRKLRREETGNH